MTTRHAIVIGAGMGGLAAAIDLAKAGLAVTVVERAEAPGGKMREVRVGESAIDAGPTVFTMKWAFDGLFAGTGKAITDYVTLMKAETLARHAWTAGGVLDLYADIDRSADAIGSFAGAADAAGYRAFCARSRAIYTTLADTFIAAQRPGPLDLTARAGLTRLGGLANTAPWATMAGELRQYFSDPRLRQLFGRYATYCGSSPYAAPATLMLVAHVEQDGVWLVQGGMARVAHGLRAFAESLGVTFHFGTEVDSIQVAAGRATGVQLADGTVLPADMVVFNGDVSALGLGLLGSGPRAVAAPVAAPNRSLSAITWCVQARTSGLALAHHTVLFADDYKREFEAVFRDRTPAREPTVYVCAQDRDDAMAPPDGPERLLLLINAPADGDHRAFPDDEVAAHKERALAVMRGCGLHLEEASAPGIATTPAGFNQLFPGSGGALYGRANHGMMATFDRPGARTRVRGLYLAGGTVHPGPGIPMATLSGRLAAAAAVADMTGTRLGWRLPNSGLN